MNPFIIYGYKSPQDFCNRIKETSDIINCLENGRNMTLFSLRKIGKTGLILNTYYKMKKKHKTSGFVYMDISPAENLKGFIKIFAESVIRQLESKPASMIREASVMLKRIRPKMTFDSISGEPSFSLSFDSASEIESSLIDAMDYLKKRSIKQHIYIAIDEFQQILNFPEKNVEALLRSHIQFMNNTNFIFSGSEQKMMLSIFTDIKRPFYQSTQMMHLEKINKKDYTEFIHSKFNKSKIDIGIEVIEYILKLTRLHTYYVQYLCNALFYSSAKIITETEVNQVFLNILRENENTYYGYRNLLPEQQWNLLKALALAPGTVHITSGAFISKYNLGSQSTVSSALKSLISKELVYAEKRSYYVYDVFFSRWLEKL